jgi:hypothetical protein
MSATQKFSEIAASVSTTNWADMIEEEQSVEPIIENDGFTTPKYKNKKRKVSAPIKAEKPVMVNHSLSEVKRALTFEEPKVNLGKNPFALLAEEY